MGPEGRGDPHRSQGRRRRSGHGRRRPGVRHPRDQIARDFATSFLTSTQWPILRSSGMVGGRRDAPTSAFAARRHHPPARARPGMDPARARRRNLYPSRCARRPPHEDATARLCMNPGSPVPVHGCPPGPWPRREAAVAPVSVMPPRLGAQLSPWCAVVALCPSGPAADGRRGPSLESCPLDALGAPGTFVDDVAAPAQAVEGPADLTPRVGQKQPGGRVRAVVPESRHPAASFVSSRLDSSADLIHGYGRPTLKRCSTRSTFTKRMSSVTAEVPNS
jgi:hypothetical protein